jgi:hypothetical protein
LAELFAKQGDLDSNALKDLRAEFASDFEVRGGFVDIDGIFDHHGLRTFFS